MLGCPWMVRQTRPCLYRTGYRRGSGSACASVLSRTDRLRPVASFVLTLAIYTGLQTWQDYNWNRYDELRGQLDIKRWVIIVAMPVGFGFSALEFLRFVFGSKLIHTGAAGVHE